MSRTAAAVVAVALFAAPACVSRMADELRADLVGLDKRSLQACMGSPWDVDSQGAGEIWVYRLPYPHRPEDVSLDASSSPVTPNVPNVSAGGKVDRSTTKSSSHRPDPAAIQPGSCLLFFSVDDGKVSVVDAAGRSWEGIQSNHECVLVARKCRP